MPLFGRRLYHRKEDDIKSDGDDTTYQIEHTGETFHSRELFEKVKKIYELDRWTCECTWHSSMTHRDAFQSEVETRKTLSTLVPTYFNKTILEIVHHSVKPLDKLAEEASNVLGQGFTIGEPVQFKKRKDSNVVKGIVERIEENDEPRKRTSERASVQARILSDKQMKNVKYAVRLSDEDRVISNVQPNELQRGALLPNREKLKTFIRSYAIRLGNRIDSPWIFYDEALKTEYQIKDRLDQSIIDTLREGMSITLEEILREQDRLQRKLSDEETPAAPTTTNGHGDDCAIVFSDDEQKKSPKKKVKSTTTSPRKTKSPSKAKKQLTLHEMKFTKSTSGNSNDLLLQKSPTVKTYNVAVPYSLLQKLDKTRRDRGLDSKLFQRLVLHCARTLNEKQRTRLPDEYRSLIQSKFEELELKRRLSEMTEQEKKHFLQTKQKEKQLARKPQEDLDLSGSKTLPLPKPLEGGANLPSHSVGDLLLICTFFTSCQSLFFTTLADDLPKSAQQFLRTFRHQHLLDAFVAASTDQFFQHFIELLQILMKFLLKEDEQRDEETTTTITTTNDDDERLQEASANEPNVSLNSDDLEQVYEMKLIDIPLTPLTCLELTRLYLCKAKDEGARPILHRLNNGETNDLNIEEQIQLLLFLVNLISTDNEFMSEYFESLTRTMSESYRERNQLLAERRKAQEEESKQKKLQLQNGENEKLSSKKSSKSAALLTPKGSQSGTTNDENHQTSPLITDEHLDSDDDLKSVTQRRRQMVAMSKELKEKKELEIQKAYQEQKRDAAIDKAEQTYQEALLNLQFGFRIKPLGFDRYYNRYWFFKGHAGLFVEKGWIGDEVHYCTQENCSPSKPEELLPKSEENQWWLYDNSTSVEQLLGALNERGVREQDLLQNLKKISPLLQQEFDQLKTVPPATADESSSTTGPIDIIAAFKADLEDIEARLRHGSLGGFLVSENLDEWTTKLKGTGERNDFAELLIQLQQTVAEKYATGFFGTHESQTKGTKNLSRKKLLLPKTTLNRTHQLQIWMNDCRTCKTFSRLYVLLMIFENSIAWNKSAAGLKCKVCRRKSKDDYIAVCDQCCQGYHLECLRGYANQEVKSSVHDLWFCPACVPEPISKRRTQRRVRTKNEYYDTDIYDMDVENQSIDGSHERDQHDLSDLPSEQSDPAALEDDEDADGQATHDDDHCCICGVEASAENELIQCIQCRQSYHCQCHEPPLRCAPRSTTWMCSHCRNGVNNETARRVTTRRQLIQKRPTRKDRVQPSRSARKNYRETDEDEEDQSDYEDEVKSQRRSKRIRQMSPMSSDESEEKSDPDENEDDEDEERERYQRTHRRVRIAKSTSESSEDDEPTHEDVEESDMIDDENVQMISS